MREVRVLERRGPERGSAGAGGTAIRSAPGTIRGMTMCDPFRESGRPLPDYFAPESLRVVCRRASPHPCHLNPIQPERETAGRKRFPTSLPVCNECGVGWWTLIDGLRTSLKDKREVRPDGAVSAAPACHRIPPFQALRGAARESTTGVPKGTHARRACCFDAVLAVLDHCTRQSAHCLPVLRRNQR